MAATLKRDLAPAPIPEHHDQSTASEEQKTRGPVRITVNLSGRAATDLDVITGLTGDSKTEAINKALQAYSLIQQAQHRGGGCWLQDDGQSEPVRSRFY